MNEYDELCKREDGFNIRREKIRVKIAEQKLKLARLDLHYTQFLAETSPLNPPNEDIN